MRSQRASGGRSRTAWLTLLFVALFGAATAEALAAPLRFDLDGDGRSDLLWYDASTGSTAVWLMNGPTDSGRSWLLTDPSWKVIATPDLNGDGKADLLWYNAVAATTSMWLMNGAAVTSGGAILSDPHWVTRSATLEMPRSSRAGRLYTAEPNAATAVETEERR